MNAPPSTHRAIRFLDDLLAGFLAAAVIAALLWLALAETGCSAGIDVVAEPLVVETDTDIGVDLGDTAWPTTDAEVVETTLDVIELDTASSSDADAGPVFDTKTAVDTADTAPPPDTLEVSAPDTTDTTPACPSGVYCAHPTGGRVGASCFTSGECCSGSCFDPIPGDGVKGSCVADPGAPGWCGTAKYPEFCPDSGRTCKVGS